MRKFESELVSSGVVEWGPFLILLKTSITAKILTLSRVLITLRQLWEALWVVVSGLTRVKDVVCSF